MKKEYKTVGSERLMLLLRNAIESPEDRWADLHHILPWCLLGTELVVRGDRPANDLEDLGAGVWKVFEGFYKRRENPTVQLDKASPDEVADRLERLIQFLRNMRPEKEVDLDLDKTSNRLDEIYTELKALRTCEDDSPVVSGLQQQACLLSGLIKDLHQEKQQREQWKSMVLSALVNLDDYICIRK